MSDCCVTQNKNCKPYVRQEEKCAIVDCEYKKVLVVTTGLADCTETIEIFDGLTLLPSTTQLVICKDPIPVVSACTTPPVSAPATSCGADTTVQAKDLLSQAVHTAPGTALMVKLCPSAQDREMVVLCDVDGTKVAVQNVTPIDAPLGTAPIFETWRLDGTVWVGIAADLKDCGAEHVDVTAAQWFCQAGQSISRTDFWDVAANPRVLLGSLWQDASGTTIPAPTAGTYTVGECVSQPAYQIVPVCEYQIGTWSPNVVTTHTGNAVTVDSSASTVSSIDTFREVVVDFGNGHLETQTIANPISYTYPALADGEYQLSVYHKFASGAVRVAQQLLVVFAGGVIVNTVTSTLTQTNPHGVSKAIQAVYDISTGLVVRYQLADGTVYVPAGAVSQECPPLVIRQIVQSDEAPLYSVITQEDTWVVEKACYSVAGSPLLPTDVLYEANTGSPLGASHGATSVADSYLHAMYAIYLGSGIAAFNADDATSPFDCSTHGGILLSDSVKVQAATDAAVTAIEVADGVPSGTYKATYYITLSGQAVWAYNAALSALVAGGTFLHPYTGSNDVFCNYQEKHDINTVSAFTSADLPAVSGTVGFPIEITKLVSPTGDVLQRRVWDDRTEPPTEIVGFDPALIGDCTPAQVTELDVVVSNWLPVCVDGVQWYSRESQVVDNTLGSITSTTKEYKQGADGTISTTAPTGTVIAQGTCTTASTTTQRIHENFVATGTTPLVIPAGIVSISVTKTSTIGIVNISGNNGTDFPLTFNRENFSDSINEEVSTLSSYTITGTLAGSSYKVHVIR